ncbi:unnamed protein product [Adineta steineri]|uniref:F-box domain-containing protein n=1 Tax=Adineta steineri TaxID=433720 RepID=A0A818QID8_9BILA|nr:unnamed protein product [Adineta steineri]
MSAAKRFKRDFTPLETLPNELFLEIFSYISGVDTVHAFSGLNNRFQCLISDYCRTFNFESISKAKFDYIIRQHDIHQWRSLHLSDNDKTPGQVVYFFRLFSFVEKYTQLKTLSISNVTCNSSLLFLPKLKSFTHLVKLSIGSKLPLESLQHTIEHHCTHEHDLTWPKALKQLKVFITQPGDNSIVRTSLKDLSELNSLTIYDGTWENPPPDGRIWEDLIVSSMPLLNKFEFCFKFWRDFSITSDKNRIISTFSTPFYLQDKSWFVQCDTYHQQFSIAILYSLPFAFQHFDIVTHSFEDSISTVNTNNLFKKSYENVKQLTIDIPCENLNETIISKNIIDLNLKFAGMSGKWIFSFTRIYQLTLGNQINISSEDFTRLLKYSPYLKSLVASYYTLQLITNQWNDKIICELLSRKIRSLKISSDNCLDEYMKVHELLPITRVFHKGCYHLNVSVYSRNIVAGLILRSMGHLRSLKVRLKEHTNDMKVTKEWLIKQNTKFEKLDCFITIDGNEYSFWFGRLR